MYKTEKEIENIKFNKKILKCINYKNKELKNFLK